MKKRLLIMGAGMLISAGVCAAEEYQLSMGVGGAYQLSPYRGVGGTSTGVPFVNFEYDKFYIKTGDVRYSLMSFGYNLYEDDSVAVSAYFNPWGGFDVDRSEMDRGYNNIDKREFQAEGGLKVVFDTGWNGLKMQVNGTYGEEGGHAGLAAFRPVVVNPKLVLVPRATLTYFTSDYLDYYFGVTESEAGRNQKIDGKYDVGSGYSFALDLAANYTLTESWHLVGFVGAERFSSDVDDSPIVEEDLIYRAGAGFNYIF